MKKSFLLAAIAAIAMSSCSHDEGVDNNTSQKSIAFGTFVEKATKGTPVTGTAYPADGQFYVMGYQTTGDITSAAAPGFMMQNVTHTGSLYNYFPVRYWPSNGDVVSFYAIHPASLVSSVTPATAVGTGFPKVSFTVDSDPIKQVDLMMAAVPNQLPSASAVNFAFDHKLTKIGFTAKLAADYSLNGTYIRVKSIDLINVASTADFEFDPAAIATNGIKQNASTSFATYSLDAAKHFVNNGSVTSTTAAQLNEANSYLLMVPSDYTALTSTAAVKVTYIISYADGTSTEVNTTKKLCDLATGNNWLTGGSISYNLTITLNAVSFSATVTEWTTPATDSAI
jgi:hypothetical protein